MNHVQLIIDDGNASHIENTKEIRLVTLHLEKKKGKTDLNGHLSQRQGKCFMIKMKNGLCARQSIRVYLCKLFVIQHYIAY